MAEEKKYTYEDSTTIRKRRHPAIYITSVIVFGLIILTFVLGPLFQMVASPQGGITFGSYKGNKISFEQNNPENFMYRYLSSDNAPKADDPISYRMAWRQAFDYAATQTYLDTIAEENGIGVSQDRADRIIAKAYTKDGVFDYENYQRLSDAEKTNMGKQAKEQIERALLSRARSMRVFSDNTWMYPDSLSYPTRNSFEYVVIPKTDIPKADALAYMNEHRDDFVEGDITLIRIDKPYTEAQDTYNELVAGDIDKVALIGSEEAKGAQAVRRVWTGARGYILKQIIKDQAALASFLTEAQGTKSALLEGLAEGTSYILRIDNPFALIDLDAPNALTRVSAEIASKDPAFAEKHTKAAADALVAKLANGMSMEDARAELPLYTAKKVQPVVGNDAFVTMRGLDPDNAFGSIGSDAEKLSQLFSLKAGEVASIPSPYGYIVAKVTEISSDKENYDEAFKVRDMPWPEYRYTQNIASVSNRSMVDGILKAKGFTDNFDKTFNKYLKAKN